MRVAALYDIHGNLPALEAVLAEVAAAGVDAIVVGGDVTPGPMTADCFSALRGAGLPVTAIRGNCERDVLAHRAGAPDPELGDIGRAAIGWVAENMADADAAWIADWPLTARLDVDGLGGVLFCHATPRSDNDIFTRITPEERAAAHFTGIGERLVLCGHTHQPFDRTIAGIRVVNSGSVGMPFCAQGAYWTLLGPTVEPRHTEYDYAAAAERIRACAYPQAESFVTGYVLGSPDEADMLARMEKAAA